ncbi:MAG: M14 family zinc carboxypeptidase [Acidobacteriota bacterium]
MKVDPTTRRRWLTLLAGIGLFCWAAATTPAQQITETRDPKQVQDEDFAKSYKEWTGEAKWGSPLVDHLPKVAGVPSPKDVLGYHIGAPRKLTYYADILKYYRALEKALPGRVKVETIGKSDENRELVVVWVSSDANMKAIKTNRDNLAKLADPRGLNDTQIQGLIATTKPHYHLMGGLHSGETGPSEMLMELVYRLATETSPIISQIRNNVYVSVTPVADADGRDRNVDWHYYGLDTEAASAAAGGAGAAAGGAGGGGRGGGAIGSLPYWGKYVFHDNNRDINLSQGQMRALTDWYFTAHPPIMHDLHESLALMYTYSGGPPQNPNLDPLLFSELPWFSNFEMAQMAKWGMPGVYTHGFMDGWSPGYLGSVAYNHNGMMKMYETQSGRDLPETAAAAPAAAAAGGGRGAGGGGRGGRGGAPAAEGAPGGGGGRGPAIPTGAGGDQLREWYRGIPIPPNAANTFTRRNNANYMETGVLSSLQLASMFPQIVVENFYVKTRNSVEEGKTKAPFGFVIPVQRDMTKAAEMVNILRAQGIEIGVASADIKVGDVTYPAGSYVIKRDQPYGRLAKNLLEKQNYPDARLTTYDDSGWTMGYAMNVEVKAIDDKAILSAATTPVTTVTLKGTFKGAGTAGMAIAHYGSNNMIAFRYALKNVPMKVAEKSFSAEGVDFPAGSFIVAAGADMAAVKAAADKFGLTAAALTSAPTVATHDGDVPRVAIFSTWNSTQELGWYRFTFDKFGIPFDLIFKERVAKGDLKKDYDVIIMAMQQIGRTQVMQPAAAKPQPYKKNDKYKFLGMYGETDDMSGGFGQAGVDAFAKFFDAGGTLIAINQATRFPIEFGFAKTADAETPTGITAQRPLITAEIVKTDSQVFYGYQGTTIPIKYLGGPNLKVNSSDNDKVLGKYVGGDASVLSGLFTGGDALAGKAFAVDIPGAYNGKGRVILFANNPIYRWQNHGEFNMVFNSIINWNDGK